MYALKGKLHIAALDGDHEGVKEALEQGADVDSIEVCKKTSKIKYYKIPVKKKHTFFPQFWTFVHLLMMYARTWPDHEIQS